LAGWPASKKVFGYFPTPQILNELKAGLMFDDHSAIFLRGATKVMNELIFIVENAPEGGLTARALGASIFTEADTAENLHEQVRDAVRCHFENGDGPGVIRLNFVREEIIPA
jgi:hypothetical protein